MTETKTAQICAATASAPRRLRNDDGSAIGCQSRTKQDCREFRSTLDFMRASVGFRHRCFQCLNLAYPTVVKPHGYDFNKNETASYRNDHVTETPTR